MSRPIGLNRAEPVCFFKASSAVPVSILVPYLGMTEVPLTCKPWMSVGPVGSLWVHHEGSKQTGFLLAFRPQRDTMDEHVLSLVQFWFLSFCSAARKPFILQDGPNINPLGRLIVVCSLK